MVESGPEGQYQPISSVWEGSDGPLIETMLDFYSSIDPEPILDATHNKGRFWKGSARQVVSMDINPKFNPMIVADNREMTGVATVSSELSSMTLRTSAHRGGTRAVRNSTRISERLSLVVKSTIGV